MQQWSGGGQAVAALFTINGIVPALPEQVLLQCCMPMRMHTS